MEENLGQPNIAEDPRIELETFQKEIAEMKRQEGQREINTVHLTQVNPNELTIEDKAFWLRVRDYPKLGQITLRDLAQYKTNVLASGNKSRYNFFGLINNKVSIIFGLEGVRKMQQERIGDNK